MTIKIAVVMDPLQNIKPYKDSTFAILLSAQRNNYEVWTVNPESIRSKQKEIWADTQKIVVQDKLTDWFSVTAEQSQTLNKFDLVLMRKDPPFDMNYFYLTHLLERLQDSGVLVSNRPDSLRNCGEKLYGLQFPQCIPHTIITRSANDIRDFLNEQERIIIKPLDGMGGQGIMLVEQPGTNLDVMVALLTQNGQHPITAQQYLPEIKQGDKRIIMINGTPIDYCLARIPQGKDIRGNLAAGAKGEGQPLSKRDRWICEQVGPDLVKRGLHFVGLDVIGSYLTEINVTSPTGIRELDAQFDLDIANQYLETLLKIRETQH